MQIGMVGLGRMGANMVRRLMRAGHQCVVYDVDPQSIATLVGEGATGAASMAELVAKLDGPRAIWLMLPAAITARIARELAAEMQVGDILIDGGNSYYREAVDLAVELEAKGVHVVDAGTSGGVWGLQRGYCMMVGGPKEAVQRIDPILAALAPGQDGSGAAPGSEDTAPLGYLHCGPTGAGHFVKMVHNGIEYGLMAAYAEGINILKAANAGQQKRAADAETAPLDDPQYYQFDIDVAGVAEVWRHGSVISSWLLDLTASALREDASLAGFGGKVSDSGEGRWTLRAAVETGVPAPVLSSALFGRFASRDNDEFANKLVSAMRFAFGGHTEKH
ncbi:MAG TPA: decarboxylating 6-phosphogluconate dehydrogenase [Devosia sp.]|nr:decarboxylating 6-phosphogluconate dehydrogenase [Devosia sp.]